MTLFAEYKARLKEYNEKESNVKTKPPAFPRIPPDLLKANLGPGKAFPGGPSCNFNGQEIPAFVTSSQSGGITPEILVDILKHLDKHGVTNRAEGDPPPCLIVDGHGSRLSIPFLRYINNLDANGLTVLGANHRWKVIIGLPNGTAYWQVADSSYINGKFKLQMRKEKEGVRTVQMDNRESIEIKTHHVVLILRSCWSSCFGNLVGNNKAIVQRGWNPLNRGCLVMPDIAKTRLKDAPNNTMEASAASSEESSCHWVCAAKDLCGLGNAPFTDKDTHRCKACGKRVHGILCCVEQTEAEEGTGPMYCKKCGREGTNTNDVTTTSVNEAGTTKLCRSEELENRYSEDPNFCKDMNPSGRNCYNVMRKFQNSDRRNVGIEKTYNDNREKERGERSDNKLMALVSSRVTAGVLAGVGQHDISQAEVLEVFEMKDTTKRTTEQNKINKKYNKDFKIYHEGLAALDKSLLFDGVMKEIAVAPDQKSRDAITKLARKQKKWLNGGDYKKLIKYKQLGIDASSRKKVPTLAQQRNDEWHTLYKSLPNSAEPTKPKDYINMEEDDVDTDEDEDEDTFVGEEM